MNKKDTPELKTDIDLQYYYGFEYLRAVMVIAVVIWHTGLLGDLSVMDITRYSTGKINFSVLICSQFLVTRRACIFSGGIFFV
ncbi:MAG: hypothetical protein PF482_10370 [Desulfobacteraceae bacterium]|jgi:hypothetical protein|nr:hypothetical protein [Desulfobacteraceae bacterium]